MDGKLYVVHGALTGNEAGELVQDPETGGELVKDSGFRVLAMSY